MTVATSHFGPESSWLSCASHGYHFVISITEIVHVLPVPDITPVLGASKSFTGATIYRGAVIPVIDIGTVFGIEGEILPCTIPSLVILRHEGGYVGARVDQCGELIYFNLSQASQSKDWIHPAWQYLVLGLYQHQNICHVVLDTSRLIATAIDDTKALYVTPTTKEQS
jgi:chemotaxis signal transduction protein